MSILRNAKGWVLGGVLALSIIIVMYNYRMESSNTDSVQAVENIESVGAEHIPQLEKVSDAEAMKRPQSESVSQASVNSAQDSLWYSERGQYEIDLWKESRGHFSESDVATYKNYDLEALEALAQQGDVKALQALALKQLEAAKPDEVIIETCLQAAVRGSTHALMLAGIVAAPSEKPDDSDEAAMERYKEAALHSLALFEVGVIRGDRELIPSMKTFIESKKLDLSDADRDRIKQKAETIYDELVAKRNALGLGNFDNSVPVFVTSSFNAIGERYSIEDRFEPR